MNPSATEPCDAPTGSTPSSPCCSTGVGESGGPAPAGCLKGSCASATFARGWS